VLLPLRTHASGARAKQMMQWVKESEQGKYDFLALHTSNAQDAMIRFPCVSFQNAKVAIRHTGDRGDGIFAVDALSAGDLIVGSKADCVLFSSEIVGKEFVKAPGWDGDAGCALLTRRLASQVRCQDGRLDELLRMSRGAHEATTDADEAPMLRLTQVVQANRHVAYKPWEGSPVGTGLWHTASKFNHACDANCSWHTVGDMLFVRCQRDVDAGEELTISYVLPTTEVKERQEYLESHQSFTCRCNLCMTDLAGGPGCEKYLRVEAMIEGSERKSAPDEGKTLKLQAAAFDFLQAPSYCSLHGVQVGHAMDACIAAYKLNRVGEAREWLQRARRAFALHYGEHPGVFELFVRARKVSVLLTI